MIVDGHQSDDMYQQVTTMHMPAGYKLAFPFRRGKDTVEFKPWRGFHQTFPGFKGLKAFAR